MVILFGLAGRAGAQRRSPSAADNAAIDYWKAAALMQQPRTSDEVTILSFVEKQLPVLPPKVFAVYPEAGQWLLEGRGLAAVLNDAAQKRQCDFGIRSGKGPMLNLEHLATLKALAARGLATAKAYEFYENTEGAATIYRDLLKLAEHIDDDKNLSSSLVGLEIVEWIVEDLEGFLSREPPALAVAVLDRYFQQRRRPMYKLGDYLRGAGSPFARWLLEDPTLAEQRLGVLYGRAPKRPAMERLVTLTPDKKLRRLHNWVMDYESWLIRLGDAVDQPYKTGIRAVRKMDKEKEELASSDDGGANPLIPLLVPTMDNFYESFLLAEGQLDMAAILTYAAVYRAQMGRWPVSLEELHGEVRRRLPKDPFTGEEFYYKLIRVRPRIVTRAPKWMARKDLVYTLDVSARKEADEMNFGRAVRGTSAARDAMETPVPLK
jgi:hypothetical protein